MIMDLEDEIPTLLTIEPSEDVANILESVENTTKGKKKKLRKDGDGEPPNIWTIELRFSKKIKERDLWEKFKILFPSDKSEHEFFQGKIHTVGYLHDTGEEVPLFIDPKKYLPLSFDSSTSEQSSSAQSKSKPTNFNDMKRKMRLNSGYSTVFVWTRLIASKDELPEDDDEYKIPYPNDFFEPEILTQKDLEFLYNNLQTIAKSIDPKSKISSSMSPKEAFKKAEKLAEMVDFCDRTVAIVIKSDPSGWKGPEIWDSMICLDLEFFPEQGSFHYVKYDDDDVLYDEDEEEPLGDHLFHVSTNSSPRKFDPVLLSNSNYIIHDLMLSCYLPVQKNPTESIQKMITAAQYLCRKLNGTLLSEYEKPFQLNDLVNEVNEVLSMMRNCQVKPGSIWISEMF